MNGYMHPDLLDDRGHRATDEELRRARSPAASVTDIERLPNGEEKTLLLFRHAANHPQPVGIARLAKRAPASESASLAEIERLAPGDEKTLALLRHAMNFPKRVR